MTRIRDRMKKSKKSLSRFHNVIIDRCMTITAKILVAVNLYKLQVDTSYFLSEFCDIILLFYFLRAQKIGSRWRCSKKRF